MYPLKKPLLIATFTAGLLTALNANAAAVVKITDRLSWDVIGLDSNDETSGPDTFAVGYRACNTGDATATNVVGDFVWDTSNAYIDIATGTPSSLSAGSLPVGECYDFYYNVAVDRNTLAFDTARQYHVAITGDGGISVSTPIDAANYNEVYVEHLISQNRNSIDSITGPTTVYQGGTYQFVLTGSTATQGYEQLEAFIDFPNNIFRIIAVDATYSTGATGDAIYMDNCGWEHDPEHANYFTNGTNDACATGDKEGGDLVLTYTVEIIGTGSATVSALIYDFSGSSFHYNADYGTDVLAIDALPPLPVGLSISDASVTEGGNLVFGLTLSSAQGVDTTVTLDPTGVSASGTDFTDSNVQVTIPAGQTAASAVIPTTGDSIDEANETLSITVDSVDAGTVDSWNTATGTIIDDDAAPSLAIGDASVIEGGLLNFAITLSNPSSTATSVTLSSTNLSASPGDYTGSSWMVAIPSGQTIASLSIATTNDLVDEASETFRLAVSSVDSGTLGDVSDTGTGTILDNDGAPVVTIGDTTITEGGSLAFAVSLSNPSASTITLTLTPSNGTAEVADYDATPVQVTFSPGATSIVASIPTVGDTMDESDETVILSVTSVDAGTVGSTADTGTGTITDDDGAPNLIIGDASSTEGSSVSFPVTLSNSSAADTTVTFTLTNGTASSSDYTTTAVQITIPAGETSGTVVVPTTDDSTDESDEIFTIAVGSVDSGSLGDTSDTATGTITDDDGVPSLTIDDAVVVEGGDLSFTVTLSDASPTDTTISFLPATGTAGAGDFDLSPVQITIPAGSTTGAVLVPTTEDSLGESDEFMSLSVASVDAGTLGDTTDTAAGTITDDDEAPSTDASSGAVQEIPTMGHGAMAILIGLMMLLGSGRIRKNRALLTHQQ